jgi:mono/diheme cytochrome c family protein
MRIALVVVSVLAGLQMAAAQTADNVKGQQLADKLCSACHATGRTGESPMAKAPAFRTLSKRYPVDSLAEALAEGIRTGHEGMPEFTLSPSEIGAFLAYLNDIAE